MKIKHGQTSGPLSFFNEQPPPFQGGGEGRSCATETKEIQRLPSAAAHRRHAEAVKYTGTLGKCARARPSNVSRRGAKNKKQPS